MEKALKTILLGLIKMMMISSILITINSCNKKNYSDILVYQNLSQDNHVLYFNIFNDLKIYTSKSSFEKIEFDTDCFEVKKDIENKIFSIKPLCDSISQILVLKENDKIIDSIWIIVQYIPLSGVYINGFHQGHFNNKQEDRSKAFGTLIGTSSLDDEVTFNIIQFDCQIISGKTVILNETIVGDNVFNIDGKNIYKRLKIGDIIKISNVRTDAKQVGYTYCQRSTFVIR